MKASEIYEILAKENQNVRSYCDQIVRRQSSASELICDHILELLLPACSEFDEQLQTAGSKDRGQAIGYLRNALNKLDQMGEDASFLIYAILDCAWEGQLKKYSFNEKLELAVITRVNRQFLFTDSNRLLSMNLTGTFGSPTHRDFTRALGFAAMVVATGEEGSSLP